MLSLVPILGLCVCACACAQGQPDRTGEARQPMQRGAVEASNTLLHVIWMRAALPAEESECLQLSVPPPVGDRLGPAGCSSPGGLFLFLCLPPSTPLSLLSLPCICSFPRPSVLLLPSLQHPFSSSPPSFFPSPSSIPSFFYSPSSLPFFRASSFSSSPSIPPSRLLPSSAPCPPLFFWPQTVTASQALTFTSSWALWGAPSCATGRVKQTGGRNAFALSERHGAVAVAGQLEQLPCGASHRVTLKKKSTQVKSL